MIRHWIILSVIAPEFRFGNYIEAGLWIVLGIGAAVWSRRIAGAARADLLVLALDLVAFGLSDVVEAQTGAWWKPLWLLAWKGICLLVMLILLARYVLRRYRS